MSKSLIRQFLESKSLQYEPSTRVKSTDISYPQNKKKSRTYVFKNIDIEQYEVDDEEEIQMPLLRSWKEKYTRSDSPETVYLEREVSKTDTLQSLSLQFGCTIAELKRSNNLISDQDFYALKIVKIPIKPHGIFSTLLPEENQNSAKKLIYTQNGEVQSDAEGMLSMDEEDVNTDQLRNGITILENVDNNLQRIKVSTENFENRLSEIGLSSSDQPLLTLYPASPPSYLGSTPNSFSCHWIKIVIVLICLCVGPILLYFIIINFS